MNSNYLDFKKRPFIKVYTLILFLISCIVYFNTLFNNYALDDIAIIRDNEMVKAGIKGIMFFFTSSYHPGFSIDFYRPLSLCMFAMEYSLFGPNAAIGHGINILCFAFSVIILFNCLDELFDKRYTKIIFFSCILFTVHPIHTEVVANIKSRDELLCFLFSFLSLYLFLKYERLGKIVLYCGGVLSLFLAYLSKETAVTFLAIIPIVFLFFRTIGNKKKQFFILTGTAIVSILYFYIRFKVLNNQADHSSNFSILDNILLDPGITHAERYATCLFILGYYLRKLLVPYPLVCDYSYNSLPVENFSNAFVILSALAYAVLLIFVVKRFIKKEKSALVFALLFFLVTISLFSNIAFLISGMMAERFVFMSSVGFCLALAIAFEKAGQLKLLNVWHKLGERRLLYSLIPLIALYSFATIERNKEWKDSYTLFSADVKKMPENAKLNSFMGAELSIVVAANERKNGKEKEILETSITYLRKALAIYPEYFAAHTTLGQTYFRLGQIDSAEVHESKALQLKPMDVETMNNLAGVYFVKKLYQKSILLCKDVLREKPGDYNTLSNMSLCYINLEQFDSAIVVLNKALSIKADFNPAYENKAIAYATEGQKDSAIKYEKIAAKGNSDFKLKW
jgi:tetratricopeptide (TPR) repeat protein